MDHSVLAHKSRRLVLLLPLAFSLLALHLLGAGPDARESMLDDPPLMLGPGPDAAAPGGHEPAPRPPRLAPRASARPADATQGTQVSPRPVLTGDLRVRVIDAQGRSVAYADVRYRAGDLSRGEKTGSDGWLRLRQLPVGRARIEARHRRGKAAVRTATIAPGQTAVLTCMLGDVLSPRQAAPSPIRGRVAGPDGEAVVGAAVLAWPEDDSGGGTTHSTSASSGADGSFELTEIQGRGEWRLHVTAPGYEPCLVDRVTSGVSGLDVRLGRAAALVGTVLHEGRGFGGELRIRFALAGRGSLRRAALIRQSLRVTDGAFRLAAVPPGEYVVNAESLDGRLTGVPLTIRVTEDASSPDLTIHLRSSSRVDGRVAYFRSEEPVARAVVILRPIEDRERQLARRATIATDASGRFALEGLSAGHYRLEIRGPGFQAFEEDLHLRDGDSATRDFFVRSAE